MPTVRLSCHAVGRPSEGSVEVKEVRAGARVRAKGCPALDEWMSMSIDGVSSVLHAAILLRKLYDRFMQECKRAVISKSGRVIRSSD